MPAIKSVIVDLITNKIPAIKSVIVDLITSRFIVKISKDCITAVNSKITANIGVQSKINDVAVGVQSFIEPTGVSVNSLITVSIALNSFIDDDSLGFESKITDNIGFISTMCDC